MTIVVGTKEEALEALKAAPPTGSRWTHSKTGHRYVVVRCAILERTLEACVIYRGLHDGVDWIRPLTEWRQIVGVAGQQVQRFRVDSAATQQMVGCPREMSMYSAATQQMVACPACAGAGCSLASQREDSPQACDGSGHVTAEKAKAMRK